MAKKEVTTKEPKAPRLSTVARLAEQLEQAQAKAQVSATKKLVAAKAERDKAEISLSKAMDRMDSAVATIDELNEILGLDGETDEPETITLEV